MPKIDLTLIPNYDSMSAEDKVKALESFEYMDHSDELEKAKAAISKANSESAEWKRKHNALLSEEDKKKQEDAERYQQMENELKDLKRAKAIADQKAKLIGIGYTEELAEESAVAMLDGDFDKILANQKTYAESISKTTLAKTMQNSPTPPAGQPGVSAADYSKKISEAQRMGDFAGAVTLYREQMEASRLNK